MTIAVSWSVGAISVAQDSSSRPLTLIERVWGEPRSYVVDRVFAPLSLAPEGLVEHKVTGYQIVDGVAKRPQYLFDLGKIREAGLATQPGFLGVVPLAGTVALETADFVVNVSADDRCIPQQVVVLDGADSVQIAVYFGQPKLPDGSPAPEAADCDADAPVENRRGFLIPVDIAEPLDDRELQSLDGTPVELVPLPSS